MLVGTKTFCLSEEQQVIDKDIDSSGYDPSSEEDEEEEMQDESRGQGNNNTVEKQQSAVGKQDKVGGRLGRLLDISIISLLNNSR